MALYYVTTKKGTKAAYRWFSEAQWAGQDQDKWLLPPETCQTEEEAKEGAVQKKEWLV
jgi:hypothetical protein